MALVRKAKKGDMRQMKKVVEEAFHRNHSAAGEFYSAQQLADQNYATQTGAYYSRDIFIKDIIYGLGEKFEEPFETFVACEGKIIVGFIITENNNGRLWINNIFVKKGRQGAGTGKQLFDFATSGRETWVWVNASNPAVGFWDKMGFRTVLQEKLMRRL